IGAPGDDDGLLDDGLLASAEREEQASDGLLEEFEWQALESSAEFGHVLYEGDEYGFSASTGGEDELDFPAISGLLSPEELRDALRHRQARQSRRIDARPSQSHPPAPQAMHRTLAEQRSLLHSLVGMQAKLTGKPHGWIHAELRRECGGPEVARATVQELQKRIDRLRSVLRA